MINKLNFILSNNMINNIIDNLPSEYINKLNNKEKSHIAKITRSYVERRGFLVEDLARLGVGYCTKGEYLGYIILPFYFRLKNICVFFLIIHLLINILYFI